MPANRADLPIRPMLYTLDQVANFLSMETSYFKAQYVHFQGRTVGKHGPDRIQAIDIAPPGPNGYADTVPEWRIHEEEFIRWLRRKGWRIYERTMRYDR